MKMSKIRHAFDRFRRCQSGAALVEFAILLPLLLLTFSVIIEGGRLMWSYQTVVAGVRDASRYLARVAPSDLCVTGGNVAGFQTQLEQIVRTARGGAQIFPTGITVNSVVPTHACVAGPYRISPAPVTTVTASLTITFPFAPLFAFAGQTLGTVNTTVTDQSRVYGT